MFINAYLQASFSSHTCQVLDAYTPAYPTTHILSLLGPRCLRSSFFFIPYCQILELGHQLIQYPTPVRPSKLKLQLFIHTVPVCQVLALKLLALSHPCQVIELGHQLAKVDMLPDAVCMPSLEHLIVQVGLVSPSLQHLAQDIAVVCMPSLEHFILQVGEEE